MIDSENIEPFVMGLEVRPLVLTGFGAGYPITLVAICANCNEYVFSLAGEWYAHLTGSYRGKHRCGSESGKPYGLEATPVEETITKVEDLP